MRIKSVQLQSLTPFLPEKIEFPECPKRGELAEVHMFTGPNGSGKSRLLAILAAATSKSELSIRGFTALRPQKTTAPPGTPDRLRIKEGGNILATVEVKGEPIFLPLSFAFGGETRLNPSPLKIMSAVPVPSDAERLSFGSWNASDLNQRIANLKVQAAMEMMNSPDQQGRWVSFSNKIEDAISDLTGRPFKVVATAHPTASLAFRWGNVLLPISGLPSGLSSILAWVYAAATMCDIAFPNSKEPLKESLIFFFDEIEAYLHPEWQRRVVPLAQNLFPNSQIFISTHSPFVISSLNDGYIYKLELHNNGVQVSEALPASKGDSYFSSLNNILEVTEIFDVESEELLKEFRSIRNRAIHGDHQAKDQIYSLSDSISSRSPELANIMGLEMKQFARVTKNK